MAIITDNPYTTLLQEAHKNEDAAKIAEYTKLSMDWVHTKYDDIAACKDQLHTKYDDITTCKQKDVNKSLTNRDYIALKQLHRDSKELCKNIGILKISTLHHIRPKNTNGGIK